MAYVNYPHFNSFEQQPNMYGPGLSVDDIDGAIPRKMVGVSFLNSFLFLQYTGARPDLYVKREMDQYQQRLASGGAYGSQRQDATIAGYKPKVPVG